MKNRPTPCQNFSKLLSRDLYCFRKQYQSKPTDDAQHQVFDAYLRDGGETGCFWALALLYNLPPIFVTFQFPVSCSPTSSHLIFAFASSLIFQPLVLLPHGLLLSLSPHHSGP